MSKNKIMKLNKLDNINSFFQINYIKGNKYIDKAGEFINALYNGDNEPEHVLTPNGGRIKINDKEEIKISPHGLWFHFVEPDSIEFQKQQISSIFNDVDSIFTPGKYTRIGWRNHYLFKYNSNTPKIVEDNIFGGDFEAIIFNKKIDNIKLRINIEKIIIKDEEKTALLIDIDLYKKFQDGDKKDIYDSMESITRILRSDNFLGLINKIIL